MATKAIRATEDKRSHWEREWRSGKGPSTDHINYLIRGSDVDGKKVLEIGCGNLEFSYLRERTASYIGIDISSNALIGAMLRHPGIMLIQADAASLPFADRTFETAVAVCITTCLGWGAKEMIREAGRVLRTDGILVFDIVHRDLYAKHSIYSHNVDPIGEHDYGMLFNNRTKNWAIMTYDEAGIEKLLNEVGLRVKDMRVLTHYELSNMGTPIYERIRVSQDDDVKSTMIVTATPK